VPARKEIRVVVEKAKVPVVASECAFEIAMLNQPGLKIGQVKNGKARIPRMTPEFALTPASSAPEIATAYWESRLDPRGGSGSHRGPDHGYWPPVGNPNDPDKEFQCNQLHWNCHN
jgi:hypothetical protein